MNKILLHTIFPLILGILIYAFFREVLGFTKIDFWGLNRLPKAPFSIPNFIKYNLPDGLWLYAFMNAIILVWESELNSKSAIWIFMIPTIGFLTELLQAKQLFIGTYDLMDLITYAIAMVLSLNQCKIKSLS